MATMFIDTKLLTDTRVFRLAKHLGVHHETALVALLRVWAVCYERESAVITLDDVSIASGIDDFAIAMVKHSELADAHENHSVRMRGGERIEEAKNDESSNARARTRTRARAGVPAGTRTRMHGSVLSSESSMSSVSSLSESQSVESKGIEDTPSVEGKGVSSQERRRITDAFQNRYHAEYGVKPRWTGKEVKWVKSLLTTHGHDEIVRRMNNMFDDAPSWIEPPYTLATLISNFDRFVITASEADKQHRERQSPKLTPNGLTYGRVEPKLAHEMDPRPPWEIMYERDDLRRDRHERENPPVFDPRRPK